MSLETTKKLAAWFPSTKIIPLSEVLATVNRMTGYLDELVHIHPKYPKNRPRNALLGKLLEYFLFIFPDTL